MSQIFNGFILFGIWLLLGFPGGSDDKESAQKAGDPGSIPGLGRFPGEGKGYSLQYSGLENSMDSPWGCKESDMTEQLSLHFNLWLEVMKITVTSFKTSRVHIATLSAPTLQLATTEHTSAGDFWILTGKSGSVSCGVTAPFPSVLVHTRFYCALQEAFSPSCVSSGGSMVGLMATSSKRAYATPRSTAP